MQQLFHQRTPPQNSAFLICTSLIYIQLTAYELSVQQRAITCYSTKTLLLIWLLIRLTNCKVKQAMMFQRKEAVFHLNRIYTHMNDFQNYPLEFCLSTP